MSPPEADVLTAPPPPPSGATESTGDDASKTFETFDADSPIDEPESNEHSDSQTAPSNVAVPVQKRRRVTRACDECRRKKIKCDGKQPCTHCTVYSYGMPTAEPKTFYYFLGFLVSC